MLEKCTRLETSSQAKTNTLKQIHLRHGQHELQYK